MLKFGFKLMEGMDCHQLIWGGLWVDLVFREDNEFVLNVLSLRYVLNIQLEILSSLSDMESRVQTKELGLKYEPGSYWQVGV